MIGGLHATVPTAAVIAPLARGVLSVNVSYMFTIEHEFDATVITLVDEGDTPLREDVTLSAFDTRIMLEQWDAETDSIRKITLSPNQLRDLAAALNLPEGIYHSAP